jgi:hypothetical protein
MVGGLGPGRYALTILAPLAAMLLSLPAFAGDAEVAAGDRRYGGIGAYAIHGPSNVSL